MSGNEGALFFRKLYGEGCQFNPRFKMFVCTNTALQIDINNQEALCDRIVILPFNAQFHKDPDTLKNDIGELIISEYLDAFFTWCVREYQLYHQYGLVDMKQFSEYKERLDEFNEGADPLGCKIKSFLDNHIVSSPGKFSTPASSL